MGMGFLSPGERPKSNRAEYPGNATVNGKMQKIFFSLNIWGRDMLQNDRKYWVFLNLFTIKLKRVTIINNFEILGYFL